MISLRIDVKKITKEKLYKGEKGTYLDAVLIPTPNSEYGDYMVVESISKEERESGVKGTILGSGKNIKTSSKPEPENKTEPKEESEDDLPF